MKVYYVYTLVNSLTGRVFYVGKGTGDRINAHERKAKANNKAPLYAYIRRIWEYGGHIIKTKVLETSDEEIALTREQELIGVYCKTLLNIVHHGPQESIEVARARAIERGKALKRTWTESDERFIDRKLNQSFYITGELLEYLD